MKSLGGEIVEFYSDKDHYPNIHTVIRNDFLIEEVERFCKEKKVWPRILEIGCGLGGTIEVLAGRWRHYLALDANQEMIDFLQKQSCYQNIEYRCASDLKKVEGSFDIVICLSVIEHVEDDRSLIQDVAKCMATGGVLIGQVPAFQSLYSIIDEYYGHCRRYDADALKILLETSGFKQEQLISQGLKALWWYEIYKYKKAYGGKTMERQMQNLQSGITRYSLLTKWRLKLEAMLYPVVKKAYRNFCSRNINAGVEFLFSARKG